MYLLQHWPEQSVEEILVKINNRVSGLELQLDSSEINLLYKDKYNVEVPYWYDHLILDVINGDNHLIMRSDELEATSSTYHRVFQGKKLAI
jgi:glucose-6-phosphate 1-dehydrogenase